MKTVSRSEMERISHDCHSITRVVYGLLGSINANVGKAACRLEIRAEKEVSGVEHERESTHHIPDTPFQSQNTSDRAVAGYRTGQRGLSVI